MEFEDLFHAFAECLNEQYPEAVAMYEEGEKTGIVMYRRSQIMIDYNKEDENSCFISFHKHSDPKFVSYTTIFVAQFFKTLYIADNFTFKEDGTMVTYPFDPEDLPSGSDTIQ